MGLEEENERLRAEVRQLRTQIRYGTAESAKGCVVLLSGGQDSATIAAVACEHFENVAALSVDYGQRHSRELEAAAAITNLLGIPWRNATVSLPVSSALTDPTLEIKMSPDGLPTSFVPGRNAVLLSIAAGVARELRYNAIGIGCSAIDFSGYPDCRPAFLDRMESALSRAVDQSIKIWAPLVRLSKAQTVSLARGTKNGWKAVGLSWTCYLGDENPCFECPACVLRAQGFEAAGEQDPAC